MACLRVLAALPAPISQRELARRAGVQVRSAQQAVEVLAGLGLVERTIGGRDHLVRLNRRHHLANALMALFDVEADAFRSLRESLAAIFPRGRRDGLEALAQFGSAARGEDTIGSDLDVLLIARDIPAREALRERLVEAAAEITAVYGVAPRVLAYALAEARAMYRAGRPPMVEIVAGAIPLAGATLRELLS